MKNYFYLFFVALFATMSFALTSCGDDDEPNATKAKGELTIDGTKYTFDIFSGGPNDSWENAYLCLLWSKSNEDYGLLFSIANWDKVKNGFTWSASNYNEVDSYLSVTWSESEAKIGSGPVSGSVKLVELNTTSNKVTVSFDKAKFEYYDGSFINLASFIIDGTITMPFDGVWGM